MHFNCQNKILLTENVVVMVYLEEIYANVLNTIEWDLIQSDRANVDDSTLRLIKTLLK